VFSCARRLLGGLIKKGHHLLCLLWHPDLWTQVVLVLVRYLWWYHYQEWLSSLYAQNRFFTSAVALQILGPTLYCVCTLWPYATPCRTIKKQSWYHSHISLQHLEVITWWLSSLNPLFQSLQISCWSAWSSSLLPVGNCNEWNTSQRLLHLLIRV
jgi:hypothetical protein